MKRIDFDMRITNVEKYNPLFSKCIIYVASPNLNRNNSFISKEAFNDATGSLYGVPIIGEYIEERDNFGGHGGKIEISDAGIKMISTTKAYGVVPESAEIYWENVEENGNTVEYLVVKDALLWTSRYPEVYQLIDKKFGQSMELEVLDDDWIEVDGKKVFNIKKFLFSALCILGVSTENDPNGHVEPCFPSSSIEAYSLVTKQFKNEFKQMMAELKFTLQHESKSGLKGGNKVEENKKELVQEEFEVKEESPSEEVFEQNPPEEMPMHDDMMGGDEKEEMAAKEQPEPDGDEEGKDTDNDGDGKEEKYELLESELTSLKESYSLLESEVKELREFKVEKLRAEKEVQVNAVFESVSSKLTEEELAQFKEKAFEMEVEDLKKELFALIGQKEFEKESNFNLNAKKPMGIALDNVPEDTTIANSYDAIIKKYNNK